LVNGVFTSSSCELARRPQDRALEHVTVARIRVALVVLLLVSRFAFAAPTLEQARNEVAALKFAAATKTLAELEAQEGFTRAEVLEYFTTLGVVRGSMGDDVGAREAFTRACRRASRRRFSRPANARRRTVGSSSS
jgi:hypothetical protein